MDEPLGMLLFFALFEILGGAALGVAFRGILRRDFGGLFFLIWGSGFAGIPFLIGTIMFLSEHQTTYFFALLFLLLTPIVTVALLPDDFMQSGGATGGGTDGGAILGAVLMMIGGTVVLLSLRGGIGLALFLGAVVGLLGILLILRTTLRILRPS